MTIPASERIKVYGIGNPLIDILAHASDQDVETLELEKGTMTLIDIERGNQILKHIGNRERQYSCGGSAPNTMITLSALGINTALAGMVGSDELGDIYIKRLNSKQVLSDLSVVHGGDTGSCIVLVTPDHERTMSTRLGVCQQFGPEHVKHDLIANADYLYFTGYMWDRDSQKEAIKAAISTAKKNGAIIAFDVADPFCVERHRDDFHDLIENQVDVLLANRDEARLLLDFDDPERASAELAKKNVIAAIKNCADGSCVTENNSNTCLIDAFTVEAVDSTGAGDNYAAGFIYGLINGYTVGESGRLASYIAAQIVRQTGAQFDEETAKTLNQDIIEGKWR